MPSEQQISNSTAERIQRSLAEAYDAKASYDIAVQMDSAGHDAKPEVQRIKFQQYVLYAVSVLRPYLIQEQPLYWYGPGEEVPGSEEHDPLFDSNRKTINGLRDVMDYQGSVKTSVSVSGGQTEKSKQPDLLPSDALRNALDWVGEAAYNLGFLPRPNYDYQ
jgi:hypothetical protein